MFLSFLAGHISEVLLPEVEKFRVVPQLVQLVFYLRGGEVESQGLV